MPKLGDDGLITLQYLEAPDPHGLRKADDVRRRLDHALSTLRVAALIVGWHAPDDQLAICRELTSEAGVALYRWHPVLSGEHAEPSNAVVGLDGEAVHDDQQNPDFTFGCPNDPRNRELVHSELSAVIDSGLFDGIFLDRIRFPSPTRNPLRDLGCFCAACQREAQADDLDLDRVRDTLTQTLQLPESAGAWLGATLATNTELGAAPPNQLLERFLRFREQSIVNLTAALNGVVRKAGLRLGLDCLSPCLTRLVGQALPELERHADWIKVMTYAHTNGHAGLPYELGLLSAWWQRRHGPIPDHTFAQPIPDQAFAQPTLSAELARSREACSGPMLAGIETVELPGIASPSAAQIADGVSAARQHGLDGVALSWDLWHTPPERLELVARAWERATPTRAAGVGD